MYNSTLLNHHSHDSIAVDLPPLFMHLHDLVYPNIAHKVAGDEDKIVGDNPMGIDITEGVPWCECLLGSDNWNDLETRAGFGPFGLPIAKRGRLQ